MIKLDYDNFGDTTSHIAAAALTAAPEDFHMPVAILLKQDVQTTWSDFEIASIARLSALYATQFRAWYTGTGSRASYGSSEFDEIVDKFQREVMGIEPDELEYHYPATAVFDYCRTQ